MVPRDTVLNMRLPAETKAALKVLADSEQRSVSAMAQILLADALRQRGYLKVPRPAHGKGR
jgi:hypothetical protein